MYNSKIWYMDFDEKISNAFNRAQNNDLNNFDMLPIEGIQLPLFTGESYCWTFIKTT